MKFTLFELLDKSDYGIIFFGLLALVFLVMCIAGYRIYDRIRWGVKELFGIKKDVYVDRSVAFIYNGLITFFMIYVVYGDELLIVGLVLGLAIGVLSAGMPKLLTIIVTSYAGAVGAWYLFFFHYLLDETVGLSYSDAMSRLFMTIALTFFVNYFIQSKIISKKERMRLLIRGEGHKIPDGLTKRHKFYIPIFSAIMVAVFYLNVFPEVRAFGLADYSISMNEIFLDRLDSFVFLKTGEPTSLLLDAFKTTDYYILISGLIPIMAGLNFVIATFYNNKDYIVWSTRLTSCCIIIFTVLMLKTEYEFGFPGWSFDLTIKWVGPLIGLSIFQSLLTFGKRKKYPKNMYTGK